MALQLQAKDIAACFTLTEVNDEITNIMAAIAVARQSLSDSFDDTQARQKTMRQGITELNNELSVWLKAKGILTGSDTATAELIAAEYSGVNIV